MTSPWNSETVVPGQMEAFCIQVASLWNTLDTGLLTEEKETYPTPGTVNEHWSHWGLRGQSAWLPLLSFLSKQSTATDIQRSPTPSLPGEETEPWFSHRTLGRDLEKTYWLGIKVVCYHVTKALEMNISPIPSAQICSQVTYLEKHWKQL